MEGARLRLPEQVRDRLAVVEEVGALLGVVLLDAGGRAEGVVDAGGEVFLFAGIGGGDSSCCSEEPRMHPACLPLAAGEFSQVTDLHDLSRLVHGEAST